MRKFAVSGVVLAVALGIALPLAGGVLAEDKGGLFPPDMLQLAPLSKVASRAVTPPVPVLVEAPGTVATDAPKLDSMLLASSTPPARIAGVTAAHRDFTASTPRHASLRRVAMLYHRRHVRHVRHITAYPVQTARVPLPPLRVAETRTVSPVASCVGFCGSYVLVGVGF